MTKKNKILLIAGIVVLVAAVAVLLGLLLPSCGEDTPAAEPSGNMTYTVEIKNANEQPLADIGVYIYEDETLAELVWYDTTDENGQMSFTNLVSDAYVAVLADVPAGYGVEDMYPITGEVTEIILYAGVIDESTMENTTLFLGDMMMDFTIVDTDGVEHTLSEILKEKKAVVLNFWFIECQPCNLEFPFLQEAYELYKKDVEVLALNPVNTDEAAIAAFKEQLGLTFPVAMVDEAWADLMRVTAYPTTIVIDRFGNISLSHMGMIEDTDTFTQIFDYFTAEDYESNAVGSIDEIVTKEEGSAENPAMQGGDTNFKVTVGAGETYHFDLIKLTAKTYMTVEGEDPFVVTYNGKEYKSDDGTVTITINPEGPSTPVPIQITNNSGEEQTYNVSLAAPKGSYSNPYKMKLGEFTAKTKAGDEQGTYYVYTAEKSGTLTVKCLSSSVKKYGFFLYNLNSYAMRNTDEDGLTDEDGYIYTSVKVKKGQKIQFNVAVARDDNNSIAAGTFKFVASLEEGTGEEEQKPQAETTVYTITVVDEAGNPVPNVSVNFSGSFFYEMPTEETETDKTPETDTDTDTDTEEGTDSEEEVVVPEIIPVEVNLILTTNEKGVATTTQIVGPYTATVRVPEGYRLGQTQYELTAEAPEVTVTLEPIIMKDYTVTLTYPTGEPVTDTIIIAGGSVVFTDAEGKAKFHLEEGDYDVLVVGIPQDYVLKEETYAFTDGNTELEIALGYGAGHETNPIVLNGPLTVTTGRLDPQQQEYYHIYNAGGATLYVEGTFDISLILNGGEAVTPEEDGTLSLAIPEDVSPVTMVVGNNGETAQSFNLKFNYPEGAIQNPATKNIRRVSIALEEGDKDGYYATWTPTSDGTVTLSLRSNSDTNCVVTVTSGDTVVQVPTTGSVVIPVEKGEPVLIHGIAIPEEDGTYPAVKIELSGTIKNDPAPVGTTYKVTLTDGEGNPWSNVEVQFVKDGTVADTETTDANGVAEVVLEPGTYTLALTDSTLIYDSEKAVVTEEAPEITLVATRAADPVPEGHTRYSVTVADFDGNKLGDLIVLFLQDGAPKSHIILEGAGETVTADLPTGTYQIQVAFLEGQKYYYDQKSAKVTENDPDLQIQAVPMASAEPESNWTLGSVTPVKVGGTYTTLQTDMETYFYFRAQEPGVYKFTTSDPAAVITYWGDLNYPADLTDTLKDYENNAFTRSINSTSLGQSHVVGIKGADACILIITRVGDAEEEIPYTNYELQTPPTEYKFSGSKLTFVDLTAPTDTYKLVLNETDGFYHIGSADGPIMYVQIDSNKKNSDSEIAPPYIHLYKMVGGVDNTGTALRSRHTDAEGNEIREDYTAGMLQYGEAADNTYGVYPLTQDLKYMIQMGGAYQGWWDAENTKGNLLFKDEENVLDPSINLELGWMFACCYVDDGSLAAQELMLAEEEPAEEELAEEEPAEEQPQEETEEIPAEEQPQETPEDVPAEELPQETPEEEAMIKEEEEPLEELAPCEEEIPEE